MDVCDNAQYLVVRVGGIECDGGTQIRSAPIVLGVYWSELEAFEVVNLDEGTQGASTGHGNYTDKK